MLNFTEEIKPNIERVRLPSSQEWYIRELVKNVTELLSGDDRIEPQGYYFVKTEYGDVEIVFTVEIIFTVVLKELSWIDVDPLPAGEEAPLTQEIVNCKIPVYSISFRHTFVPEVDQERVKEVALRYAKETVRAFLEARDKFDEEKTTRIRN